MSVSSKRLTLFYETDEIKNAAGTAFSDILFQIGGKHAFLDLHGVGDVEFFRPLDVLFDLFVFQHVGGDQTFLIDHVVDEELGI